MKHRPDAVPKSMFKQLMKIWEDDPHTTISERNSRNRLALKEKNIMHTAGLRSFARVAAEWKKKNKTTKDPSPAQMFIETRKEKSKRKFDDPRDQIINELNQPNKDLNVESGDTVATIASIFGHNDEKRRRLRLYGRGVTCTQLKQRAFEEQLEKKREEEVKALAAEYEEKRQKDRSEVGHALRILLSEVQKHNPDMRIDPCMFGSLLADDSSTRHGASNHNALSLRHPQSSTSTNHPNDQEVNFVEDGEEEDLT